MLRAGRFDISQERAASQHPGDGLKPSLEIAPPGATPNHSGCPLGERPYGLEDAQGGCHPAPLSRRTQCASTKQATIGWKNVMSTILARRPGGTVPPRSWQEVPQVASRSRTATGSSHPGASTGGLAGSDVLRRPASEDLLGSSKRKKSTCSVKPICPRSPARLHRFVKPQPSPGKNGARKPGLQSRTRKPGP